MRFHEHSNSRKFSITYQNLEYGQLLVLLVPTGKGTGLGVEVHFNVQELGLCNLSLTFGTNPDSEGSKRYAYLFMNRCDEDQIVGMVAQAISAAHLSRPDKFTAPAHPHH